MGLRERWRQNRERSKKIDEAIERGLTPEQKLAIHRNHSPSIFPAVILIVLITLIIALVAFSISTGYGLREAFGENEWENLVDKGLENANVSLNFLGWIPIIFVGGLLALFVLSLFVWGRRDTKLKREILARLEAERS